MQKQLNPDLFGSEKRKGDNPSIGQGPVGAPHIGRKNYAPTVQWVDDSVANRGAKAAENTAENQQLRAQLEDLQNKFLEYQKINQTRFERYNQAITQLQESMQILVGEWTQKITSLHNKLSDRQSLDNKMHEAVDRHNTILKACEVRMGHLQKSLNGKDEKLKETQATLNAVKMELASYKRVEV
jgi:chromosome segregation ATPase